MEANHPYIDSTVYSNQSLEPNSQALPNKFHPGSKDYTDQFINFVCERLSNEFGKVPITLLERELGVPRQTLMRWHRGMLNRGPTIKPEHEVNIQIHHFKSPDQHQNYPSQSYEEFNDETVSDDSQKMLDNSQHYVSSSIAPSAYSYDTTNNHESPEFKLKIVQQIKNRDPFIDVYAAARAIGEDTSTIRKWCASFEQIKQEVEEQRCKSNSDFAQHNHQLQANEFYSQPSTYPYPHQEVYPSVELTSFSFSADGLITFHGSYPDPHTPSNFSVSDLNVYANAKDQALRIIKEFSSRHLDSSRNVCL